VPGARRGRDAAGAPRIARGGSASSWWAPVGTVSKFHTDQPGSEVRIAGVYGVVSLRLVRDGYQWRFLGEPAGKVLDSGSGRCH
jgi:hypothetical protein